MEASGNGSTASVTPPATVRVAVRMRELSTRERENRERLCWLTDARENRIWLDDAFLDKARRAVPDFQLDHVFTGPDTAEVYRAFASKVVWAAMEGFHGTVFAYGQTNSGKTYTMLGDEHARGIIPRAVDDVFRYIKQTPSREFLLRVSYMEIYNETINDLLTPTQRNLQIHESKQHGIYVSPLSEEIVRAPGDVMRLIKRGQTNRHVSATDYNEYSSRSHTIFQLTIESNERALPTPQKGGARADTAGTGRVKLSHLNLIDLAGSEKSSSNADRQKEGSYINKSLLTLGTVIAKLSEGKPGHIPFRDSKLTRILQTSLSGKAYVAMIATISPSECNTEESHNTLKFAARAKNIAIDAKQNEVEDDKALLKRYRTELATLRDQLAEVNQRLHSIENTSNNSLDQQAFNQLKLEKQKMEDELRQQSMLAVRLREEIQHLTGLILTSATVATPARGSIVQSPSLERLQLSDAPFSEGAARAGSSFFSTDSPLNSPLPPIGRPMALPFTKTRSDDATLRRDLLDKEHMIDRIGLVVAAAEKMRGLLPERSADLIARLERVLLAGASDTAAAAHIGELQTTLHDLEEQRRHDRALLSQMQRQLEQAQLETFTLRLQQVTAQDAS